jgi:hypothetical protein
VKKLILMILPLSLAVGPALADWDVGEPNKWVQLPDLAATGVDVDIMNAHKLADDFQCDKTERITDIHLWSSFADDIPPWDTTGIVRDPGNMKFRLSIHADIPDPDGGGPEYSQPGQELWHMYFAWDEPGNFTWRVYEENLDELFWDPLTGTQTSDTICYQYNFDIPYEAAFEQQEGTIYWLQVMAWPWDWTVNPYNPTATFGWKSSLDHWNDDAVYWDESLNEGAGGWLELRYPLGHPYEGESMDLAFVLTPEPATILMLSLGGLLLRRRR